MELFGKTANQIGIESGFIKRKRKIDGASFAKAMVFGFQSNPKQTYSELSQSCAAAGVKISNQGIEQRMDEKAAKFLQQLLNKVIQQKIMGDEIDLPLIKQFNGIYLRDSSVVSLPKELKEIWPGVGGSAGENAAVKLQVSINYTTGQLHGPILHSGRTHDQESPFHTISLPKRALRLADLGFFDLDQLLEDEQNGIYWLTRLKTGTVVHDGNGNRLDLLRWLQALEESQTELPIYLGAKHRIPCRLLIQKVPSEVAKQRRKQLNESVRKKQRPASKASLELVRWTLLVTNVDKEKLSIDEALMLIRVRWQIELLFKLWKSYALIDEWRSKKPWRILCELYAKLIGVVISHWIQILGIWGNPEHSLFRSYRVIQKFSLPISFLLLDKLLLEQLFTLIFSCLQSGCNIDSRKLKPNTYQFFLSTS